MISAKHRCIFVHIPKVAGQSIEQFFLDLHGLTWEQRGSLLLRHNPDPAAGPSRLAHLLASEYVERGHISAQDYASFYKFSFVRNPWARLVSEYSARDRYKKKFSFRKWVLEKFPEPDMYTDRYRHVIPQYDYLYDGNGELLVDFVGRFENLQQDFATVCSQLGITEHALPHRNASQDRIPLLRRIYQNIFPPPERQKIPYTDYYDDDLREHVARLYDKDIKAFGYRFD